MPALTQRGIIEYWMVKINIKGRNLSLTNSIEETDGGEAQTATQSETKRVECIMTFMSSSGVIFVEVGEQHSLSILRNT